MMTSKHKSVMADDCVSRRVLHWQWVRRCDQAVVLATIVMTLALFCTGCAITESVMTKKLAIATSTKGAPVEIGVVAVQRVVTQNGQQISGLVVQVVLLDATEGSTGADGGIVFSIYSDEAASDKKVEADYQWTFTAEQFNQAVSQSATLGTVHNFWLPLKGNLAAAKRLQLLTIHTTAAGLQLSQWNQVLVKDSPVMTIEHYTDGKKSDEDAEPVEEPVPVEKAAASRTPVKK